MNNTIRTILKDTTQSRLLACRTVRLVIGAELVYEKAELAHGRAELVLNIGPSWLVGQVDCKAIDNPRKSVIGV